MSEKKRFFEARTEAGVTIATIGQMRFPTCEGAAAFGATYLDKHPEEGPIHVVEVRRRGRWASSKWNMPR